MSVKAARSIHCDISKSRERDEAPARSCCLSRLPETTSTCDSVAASPGSNPKSVHCFLAGCISSMSWLFLDWFVPFYLLVSVLVLAGFGACLYFLEPGLQDAHKWSSRTVRHHPLVASVNCRDDDTNALI
ncbi:hypothetical protein CRUP_021457 [Coryphaenoides rupestris]|nr:hypothetical protein CRUP_021457 [Coryphaenoides rupestris]